MSVALINEVLRDFERYTGDGKPNAPIGHPLPIGDPRSGIHNPAKFRLRELLIAILQAMGDPDALQDILNQLGGKADLNLLNAEISSRQDVDNQLGVIPLSNIAAVVAPDESSTKITAEIPESLATKGVSIGGGATVRIFLPGTLSGALSLQTVGDDERPLRTEQNDRQLTADDVTAGSTILLDRRGGNWCIVSGAVGTEQRPALSQAGIIHLINQAATVTDGNTLITADMAGASLSAKLTVGAGTKALVVVPNNAEGALSLQVNGYTPLPIYLEKNTAQATADDVELGAALLVRQQAGRWIIQSGAVGTATIAGLRSSISLVGAPVDGFENANTEGFLTIGNGQIASASASWTYTDFIPVRAGQVVEYVGGINRDQGAAIAYYDSNQGYVADGLVADPAGSGPIQSLSASVTIPAGVSYLRAATINTGTYGLTYIPSGSTSPEAFAESVISTMEHAAGVEKMRLQAAVNALLSGSALPSKLANLPGIGDSITVGANATTAANRFLNRVAAALGATVTNYGIGGTVLQNSNGSGGAPLNNNGRDRFRGLFTGGSKKDFALIAYGFNDARYTAAPSTFNAAAYKNDYREILVGLLCDGYRRDQLLIVGPHYITDIGLKTGSEGFTGQTRAGFEEYVTTAREVAEEFGTLYFDSYTHMRDYMRDNGSPYDMSTFSDNAVWDIGDGSATYVGTLTTVSNNQGGNISPVPEGELWISADIRRLGGTTGRARIQIRWLSSENPDTVISTTSGDYITLSDTSVQIFTNEGTPPEGAVFYDLMLTVDGANTDGQVQFSNITVGQGVISDDNIHPTNLGHEVIATGVLQETTVLNQRSAPVITEWSASGSDLLLAWAPVAGAVSYEVAIVEFDSLAIPTAEAVSATQHRFSAPPTGRHIGMVRAVFSDEVGPWSVSNPAAI